MENISFYLLLKIQAHNCYMIEFYTRNRTSLKNHTIKNKVECS